MDLFRYTSSGVADYTTARTDEATYFSSNGGATIADENRPERARRRCRTTTSTIRPASRGTRRYRGLKLRTQVFGATADAETLSLTQTELDVMQALGWHLTLHDDVDNVSGDWETAANWALGCSPIEAQDASIGGASGTVSATLDANVTVYSIATSANSQLIVGDKTPLTLIAYDGTYLNPEDVSTVPSGNLGKLYVESGSVLQVGNTLGNSGTLTLGYGSGGEGDTAYLYINGSLGGPFLKTAPECSTWVKSPTPALTRF